MTDDNSDAVAQRIAWQLIADADAEYRANPAARTRDDVIARHVTAALVWTSQEVTEMLTEAAGAMGRPQA